MRGQIHPLFFCNSPLPELRDTQGPTGTPYEGGTFQVSIRVPEQYPLTPPVAKFVTKVPQRPQTAPSQLGAPTRGFSLTCPLPRPRRSSIRTSTSRRGCPDVGLHHDQAVESSFLPLAFIVAPAGNSRRVIQPPLARPAQTGEICLDILKNAWSPAWTLQSVCRAIAALLAHAEPDSPLVRCPAPAEAPPSALPPCAACDGLRPAERAECAHLCLSAAEL